MRGLGNDIVEIDRIKRAHKEHGSTFLSRFLTEDEQVYCMRHADPYPRIAGRFAAKEAVAKALGTGFGAELSWRDVEILPNDQGKPLVSISRRLKDKYPELVIHVSISHAKAYATAVAIAF